ncbi:MAG: alpha/beta fold hydrolase [Acetobacteraceae bacterium]
MPYAEFGGISLHYTLTGTGGPPILLLHELGGSSDSWVQVIPLLATGRRVVALDLRGAGRSEKPVAPFPLAALADDAAGLLTHLQLGTTDVIGAALGSLVGVLLAGRHPALVRRLALFAVAEDMSGPTASYLHERAARVRDGGMRVAVDASLANAFPPAFEAARTAYRPQWLGNDPIGYALLSAALAEASLDAAVWQAVQAPTLVASGALDFIWPPERGRATAALIAGAQFTELTEAGHFPHLQTPAAVAALVGAFFSADGTATRPTSRNPKRSPLPPLSSTPGSGRC